MMTTSKIKNGVYAASLTPLHADLSCNDELLTTHCLQLIDKGCQGIVLFGTTGEGASFSVSEKLQTVERTISRGLDPQKIILGNGSACLPDTVELCLATLEHNCLACLISPPCYFKNVTEEGVISFYREVIQRVSNSRLRIILYHIPQYTAVPITSNIVRTLCVEFPGIVVGLKESEGNLSLVKEILDTVPQCKVFVGKESQMPLAITYGASGTICGMANLWPELICALYDSATTGTWKNEAIALENASSILKNRPFISGSKTLLSKENPKWRFVRPPLT
ncbi:MAG: dihydrodipicolinate synthase family protein [Parachlamydiaceae bacterium]